MGSGRKAAPIEVTEQERKILERISRERASGHSLVQRGQMILSAADGQSNEAIAKRHGTNRETPRRWRQRWTANVARLKAIESHDEWDESQRAQELEATIRMVLSDAYRSGTPGKFSPEEQVKIVAVGCEDPQLSGRAITHWTPRELADEVMKREIVKSISVRSVGRFLKRGGTQAALKPILANQPTQRRGRTGEIQRPS